MKTSKPVKYVSSLMRLSDNIMSEIDKINNPKKNRHKEILENINKRINKPVVKYNQFKIEKNIPFPDDYKKENHFKSKFDKLADKMRAGDSVVMLNENDINCFRQTMKSRGRRIIRRQIKENGKGLKYRIWCVDN